MLKIGHRVPFALVAALLAAQLIGPLVEAAQADRALPAAPHALFQNACTAQRQEQALAEAEGREPEDVVTAFVPSWRRALNDFSRYGPIEPRYCWQPAIVPDEPPAFRE